MSRSLSILLALAATALIAGCIGGDDAGNETDDTGADNATAAALPPPIEASEEVTGSADPLSVTGAAACDAPTAQCFRYPFELNTTATISIDLTWTVPAHDFDVYLFQDGEPITTTEGGSPPPGTQEAFDMELEPGAYEVVVSPYSVSQDTFTLSATFA